MRHTRIDIEGQRDHFASLTRKRSTNWIDIEILTPEIELQSAVPADNRDEQWIAAQHIQEALDGVRGTNSMIHDYFRIFECLAD